MTHLLEWLKSKTPPPKASEDVGQQEVSSIAGANAEWNGHFRRQFLIKLNVFLPYDPSITLLGVHPNELKMYVHTKTCPRMVIAASFIITRNRRQPRCPSVGEQINKHQYVIQHSEEMSYGAIKRHKVTPMHIATKPIEKNACCRIPTLTFWKRQNDRDREITHGQGLGEGGFE
jgi:hypothetical protein